MLVNSRGPNSAIEKTVCSGCGRLFQNWAKWKCCQWQRHLHLQSGTTRPPTLRST